MKILSLVFIFLIGILGMAREPFFSNEKNDTYFNWQCPATIKKCPDGCIAQKEPKYKCGNKVNYTGPRQCSKACPYICSDRKKCANNECCEQCGVADVPTKCASFEGFGTFDSIESLNTATPESKFDASTVHDYETGDGGAREANEDKLKKQREAAKDAREQWRIRSKAHIDDLMEGKSHGSQSVGLIQSDGSKWENVGKAMRIKPTELTHISGAKYLAGDSLETKAPELPAWYEYWQTKSGHPARSGAPPHTALIYDKAFCYDKYFNKSKKQTTETGKIYTFNGEINGEINGLTNYEMAEPTLEEEEKTFYAPYMKDDDICKRLMF